MAIKRDYAPAKKDSGKATLTEVNGVKIVKGEDTGTVDGEWFKTQVSNLPKGIHLVDVRKADQFKEGNLKGSINVPLDSETSAIDSSKIPSEGIVVLYCNTGMMSTDARVSLQGQKYDVSRVFVFDANIECTGQNCKIEPNEPLGL